MGLGRFSSWWGPRGAAGSLTLKAAVDGGPKEAIFRSRDAGSGQPSPSTSVKTESIWAMVESSSLPVAPGAKLSQATQ